MQNIFTDIYYLFEREREYMSKVPDAPQNNFNEMRIMLSLEDSLNCNSVSKIFF